MDTPMGYLTLVMVLVREAFYCLGLYVFIRLNKALRIYIKNNK